MRLAILMTVALALLDTASAADPARRRIELNSERIGGLGLPLAEGAKPVHGIGLTAALDQKGEGSGVLVLDLNGLPTYDEFGFPTKVAPTPAVKLDCTLKFVKKTTAKGWPYRLMEGPTEPENPQDRAEYEWRLYSITGQKITSRLFLAVPMGQWSWTEGRLLVHGKHGKVRYVIDLEMPRYKP
jgi:hypothetical protein